MITFNKPKYIRKYDFIYYFTRPQDQWFIKSSVLTEFINRKIKASGTAIEIDDNDEEIEEFDFDPLEILKDLKQEGADIDMTDPKVHEGNIIDRKAREFIHKKFRNLKVFDFDEIYKDNHDLDFRANETKKFLEKDNYVLFQPVFIYKNKAIALPDAFVKEKGKYSLIEVKGTSKPKPQHFVDVLYQHYVISYVLSERDESFDNYYLCLVKYDKGEKKSVDLALTEYIPISPKGGRDWSNEKDRDALFPGLQRYSDQAIKFRGDKRLGSDSDAKFKELLQGDVSKLKSAKNKAYVKHIAPLLEENLFENIIDELIQHKPKAEPSLQPDLLHFKTWFKDYSLLKEIRTYYASNPNEYPSLCWSGFVFPFKLQIAAYKEHDANKTTLRDFFISQVNDDHKTKDLRFFDGFQNTLYKNFAQGIYRIEETKQCFSKLKTKKVYFDFESINPATRVMDDTTPYTQIVTQVSVIKDNGQDIDNAESNNIVIDPQTINIGDFKKIIDAIYSGEQYSYIVYNKSFECTRLNEMAAYINESDYINKVKTINANIYDLADFFDPRKNLITILELHGNYSIKVVLPIIEKYAPDIFKATGCKDYHSLELIQNGGEALNQTSRRFFSLINDEQWNRVMQNLKTYCENDVRAMIAVEYYIKRILL